MRDIVTPLFVIVVVLLVLVLAPFVTIWSLNTLFSVGIEYTLWTWLAAVWLSMVTFGGIAYNTKKKDE